MARRSCGTRVDLFPLNTVQFGYNLYEPEINTRTNHPERKLRARFKNFCPLLLTAIVFVSYGFVLVQVEVRGELPWHTGTHVDSRVACSEPLWYTGTRRAQELLVAARCGITELAEARGLLAANRCGTLELAGTTAQWLRPACCRENTGVDSPLSAFQIAHS